MDSDFQKIHQELTRQGLIDTARFFEKMQENGEFSYLVNLEMQTLWTLASLETRLKNLELVAGIENVAARQLPDEEAFEALRATFKG